MIEQSTTVSRGSCYTTCYILRQAKQQRLSLCLFCEWVTRPLKNVVLFLSAYTSISPLVAYFTHAAEELSLEESGKHQRGMRRICVFFFLPKPPPYPLLSLLWMPQHSQPFEFSLVSVFGPTITTSHKQWALLIGELRRRVAVAGPRSQICWQEASRVVLNVQKYRLY